ncbi:hypothetical protein HanRHA438_Chr11g0485281 [Helianthus annuus]|nr:hypothetical protein HanRHA438_Chr11g0485281 [Helianthus annuus]
MVCRFDLLMMLYHNLLAFLYLQQSVQESNHEFSFEKGKCVGFLLIIQLGIYADEFI